MKTSWTLRTNLTMLIDFYELTMSKGYLQNDFANKVAVFDLFFRDVPENGGYAIMAGVEQMVEYLSNLSFSEEDLAWLATQGLNDAQFLEYLRHFEFCCDVWAVREGSLIFPHEPVVKVRGPIIQAQMIETMLLVTINHQSLIATKTARIVRAAKGRPVLEFGARRAQGYDASVLGARAAYIAGCSGTSCTISGKLFDVPVLGTMAHSWVLSFGSEYDAFAAYAKAFPEGTVLLVDTYNTLRSGVPNAIKVAHDVLEPMGKRLLGIRIDSGDLTYLTEQARKMLDAAGLLDCKITVSNSIDEYLIRDLLHQGASIDAFGVGERLITSRAEPVFGGVYKLAAIEENGILVPRMKLSDNPEKVTNPASKEVWRLRDKTTGFALADLVALEEEVIDETKPLVIFDPIHTWKQKEITNFTATKLLEPIFLGGKDVSIKRSIAEIREHCRLELSLIWESVKRFENPQTYYVDLSKELWSLREKMLHERK